MVDPIRCCQPECKAILYGQVYVLTLRLASLGRQAAACLWQSDSESGGFQVRETRVCTADFRCTDFRFGPCGADIVTSDG